MDPETVQQVEELVRELVGRPHSLEVVYWLANVAIAGVAGYALWFAYHQVMAARRSNEATLKQAHATFLLELDRRWDSEEMFQCRVQLLIMRDGILARVGAEHARLDDNAKARKIGEEFAKDLKALRDSELENYLVVLRMCGFFETVGLMVKKEYVALDDITSLFKGSIIAMGTYFSRHIEERQKEMGVPGGFFENALYLVDEVENLEKG